MSAILNWIAWCAPIGRPNASRWSAYFTASSRHPCARPTESAATPIRPSASTARHCEKPRPRWPSRCSCGTRHSRKTSSCVSLARHPSLRYDGPASNPGVSVGTMIVEMPCGPPAGSVAAATMLNVEIADPEFVMNAFEPSTIHSPPSNRPVVCTSAASEPAPGSVSPNPPSASPRASGASQRSFCSSVPNRFSRLPARPSAADKRDRRPTGRRGPAPRARGTTVIASASGAPDRRGEREPEQPEVAHLLDDVERELLLQVGLGRPRSDHLVRELADDPAERLLLRRQIEVHADRNPSMSTMEPVRSGRERPRRRGRRSRHGPSPTSRCISTVSAPSSLTSPIVSRLVEGSPSMPTWPTVNDSSVPPGPHSVSAVELREAPLAEDPRRQVRVRARLAA